MVTLNDYLYSGDTVLKILHNYSEDLRENAIDSHNQIDLLHCNFLLRIIDLLEHNDFLTAQSHQIRDFYSKLTREYPYLAFTVKGRIKSLIRAEMKFNGYVVGYIFDYYKKNGAYPSVAEMTERLNSFRDLIAYRIVVSLPKCHVNPTKDRYEQEISYLYEIANKLPEFMIERGFTPRLSGSEKPVSERLAEGVRPYYRDYIENKKDSGYQSLHITFYDNNARTYLEIQLRTKDMDDYAEIGLANHTGYENQQKKERSRRDIIPEGECVYFDEAYERGMLLQNLELSKLDVNMFGAVNNSLINDGCGLFRGRTILPYEHLSRFQNDVIV